MHNFDKAVRKAMSAKKMTIATLAKETGYSYPFIHDLLHGKRRWNVDNMASVVKVVGLKVAFTLEEGDDDKAAVGN